MLMHNRTCGRICFYVNKEYISDFMEFHCVVLGICLPSGLNLELRQLALAGVSIFLFRTFVNCEPKEEIRRIGLFQAELYKLAERN